MKLNQILNHIKVSLTPSSRKTHSHKVEKIAYKIYQNRLLVKGEGDAEQDWHKAEQIVNNPLTLALFKCHQPFISIEKKFLEPFVDYLHRLALLEILGLLGNLSLLFGVIVFIAGEQDRRNAEVYQAWQVVTAAHNQAGSGGRKEALEFLNSEPRRIPWFWLTWDQESLDSLQAPKAYLKGVQLCYAKLANANLKEANLKEANLSEANLLGADLQQAYLWRANFKQTDLVGANLQQAYLWEADLWEANLHKANLKEADLWEANLHKTNLKETNLQQAYLLGANLTKADLSGANLKDALYSDETTSEAACQRIEGILFLINYPCPTMFPEGFDPKAAGMKLIKEMEDIPERYLLKFNTTG
ncbi:pentapeptide repeat-containing protein [Moorena sp. SIO3H5]|uniref:pentapeptide repeat-containing protein n=1 Tax=Moorena sp. SIO3H5 TaxID=2607834 RepID=UPI0013BE6612|nr:pentapeptide repeat-containing protein [Moorena sp. SIO3H5]NEO68603.1 pentapeptide repeat-containing protein [Moorena sp. SIO3H5]